MTVDVKQVTPGLSSSMRAWFANRDNLALCILAFTGTLLIAVIYQSEALNPERSARFIDLWGWRLDAPYRRGHFNEVLAWAAGIAGGLIVLHLFLRRLGKWWERFLFLSLAILAIVSSGAALLQYTVTRPRYFDVGDTFSYFVGPKYFDEIGYDQHYGCAALSQQELGHRIPPRARDLTTNRVTKIEEHLTPEKRRACKARFTPERWKSYTQDIETFRTWHSRSRWHHRFIDHGYNGTPFHQFVAGNLANAVELDHRSLVLLALLNHLVVFVVFGFVVRAFGWRFGLLFVVLFFSNIPDRWLLGGTYLRFLWIACLVTGVSLLRLKRYGSAAVLLVCSAFLSMFPVFFLLGIVIKMAMDLWKRRSFEPNHVYFVAFGALAVFFVGLLTISHGFGVQNWTDFLAQMDLNSGRLATGRIGFIYNFLWPKEMAIDDEMISYHRRLVALDEPLLWFVTLNHLRYALIAAILGLVVYAGRRMDDVELTVLLGFSCFFLFLSTVRYYYAGLAGLPLVWYRGVDKYYGVVLFIAFLAISAFGPWLELNLKYCFIYNTYYPMIYTATIIGLSIFFLVSRRRKKSVSVAIESPVEGEIDEAVDDSTVRPGGCGSGVS